MIENFYSVFFSSFYSITYQIRWGMDGLCIVDKYCCVIALEDFSIFSPHRHILYTNRCSC